MNKKVLATLSVLLIAVMMLCTACGSSSDYNAYATAYNKVMANGGFDADITANLKTETATKTAEGNFKVDNSGDKTILLLEVNMDGKTVTQFSDGEYLYTDAQGKKMKYPLGEKADITKEADDKTQTKEAPKFEVETFLSDFANFLEAGKIQELGLLSPIDSKYITETTREGDVFTLKVNDDILKVYLNTLAQNIIQEENTVKVEKLENFEYKATVSGDYITNVQYIGDITVSVSSAISASGSEETYVVHLDIGVVFNNPGSAVSITLPSTEGF